MESLKTMDLDSIDLYECFKAFVREDDLGDEECWYIITNTIPVDLTIYDCTCCCLCVCRYCKQCKTHQEAVKSLEIWRLPPILVGHWIQQSSVCISTHMTLYSV